MSDPTASEKCGRPTKQQTPCQVSRPSPRWAGSLEERLPACRLHLTDAEKRELKRREERGRKRWYAQQRKVREFDPACWSWPIPEQYTPDGTCPERDNTPPRPGVATPRVRRQFDEFHGDHCAVCGKRDQSVRGLFDDHDHFTGRIRGRLCHACNHLEGRDDWPNSAIERYRERNPATILGFVSQYVHPWGNRTDWGDPLLQELARQWARQDERDREDDD